MSSEEEASELRRRLKDCQDAQKQMVRNFEEMHERQRRALGARIIELEAAFQVLYEQLLEPPKSESPIVTARRLAEGIRQTLGVKPEIQ